MAFWGSSSGTISNWRESMEEKKNKDICCITLAVIFWACLDKFWISKSIMFYHPHSNIEVKVSLPLDRFPRLWFDRCRDTAGQDSSYSQRLGCCRNPLDRWRTHRGTTFCLWWSNVWTGSQFKSREKAFLLKVYTPAHWPPPGCTRSNLPAQWERRGDQMSPEGWAAPVSLNHRLAFFSLTSFWVLNKHEGERKKNDIMKTFQIHHLQWKTQKPQHSRSSLPFSLPRSFLSFLGFLRFPSSPVDTTDVMLSAAERPETPAGAEVSATGCTGGCEPELGVGMISPSVKDWYCSNDFSKNLKI